jgi:hypothetical protein
MDPSDAPAAAGDDSLPPYTGANLPFPGLDENGDPPLVRLVKKLYAAPAESAATPMFNGALDLFPFVHDCAILREPFSLEGGHSTRACLMGDSCVGHNTAVGATENNFYILRGHVPVAHTHPESKRINLCLFY